MKRMILLTILFFCAHHAFNQQIMYMAKSSYGVNGIANTYAGNCMAMLPYGKIIVADTNFMARYHIDGNNDLNFGYIGTVPIYSGVQKTQISITSIAVQHDGKIVVAGFLGNHPQHYFAVARFFLKETLTTLFQMMAFRSSTLVLAIVMPRR